MSKPLTGTVVLVTGATRGLGRGIAIGLGEAGATVHITGRTLPIAGDPPDGSDPLGGSLEETCAAVEAAGGTCSAHRVDHHDDDQVRELFVRIGKVRNGQLDLLVNNAYAGVGALRENR